MPERRCGLELNRECDEQLEVFATFGRKLWGRQSQETGLGSHLCREWEIPQLDVQSAFRGSSEMSGIPTETVAEIDHSMRTSTGEPQAGGKPWLGVSIALPGSGTRLL
jgi:hypothetical protein